MWSHESPNGGCDPEQIEAFVEQYKLKIDSKAKKRTEKKNNKLNTCFDMYETFAQCLQIENTNKQSERK